LIGKVSFADMRAVVSHPRDADGELIIRFFQRSEALVQFIWPPPDKIDKHINFLVCLVDPAARALLETTTTESAVAVMGILDPARQESLRLLSEVTPHSVIMSPVAPAALLPNVVVARHNAKFQQRLNVKISKLEETLRSYRKVEQAKAILMRQRQIDEPEAYNFLREQAMRRRVPVGVIASAVVDLNEVLSDEKK
jgi:AmiR/NasT family two-component response regulator